MISKADLAVIEETAASAEEMGTLDSRKVSIILSTLLIICDIQDKTGLQLLFDTCKKYLRNCDERTSITSKLN